MRKLPEEYCQIHKLSQAEKCIAKTNDEYFKSVAPDMKLLESKEYLIFQKEKYARMFPVRR